MFRIVLVEFLSRMQSWPLKHTSPLNAVLWESRCISNCAYREGCPLGEHIETAFIAAGDGGENDTRLTFEPF